MLIVLVDFELVVVRDLRYDLGFCRPLSRC